MADSKITALTSISTSTDPANDPLVIVDVSDTSMAATGTTKKVTLNNLLACSPTATLASATITGDLTVKTNVLKVDTTNNRVGIGTATPLNAAQIQGIGQATVTPTVTGDGSALSLIDFAGFANSGGMVVFGAGVANGNIGQVSIKSLLTNGSQNGTSDLAIFTRAATSDTTLAERFRIAQGGICTWSNVGGVAGTAMTLNSTGLGVGASPQAKLHVSNGATIDSGLFTGLMIGSSVAGSARSASIIKDTSTPYNLIIRTQDFTGGTAGSFIVRNGSTDQFQIDSSGNVGIGVTPITSHILSCAGPVGITGTLAGSRTSYITNSSAASIYYTDGGGSGYFTDFGNLIIQPRTSAARSVVIATGSTTPVERAVVKSTGQVRFVPLAADPAGAEAGDVYYNSVSNRLKYYNGTAWTLI